MSDQNQRIDVDRALDAWTPMEPPADFVDRVLSARPLEVPSRTRSAWWLAAPAMAVAMIAIVLIFANTAKKDAATQSRGAVAVDTTMEATDSRMALNGAGSSEAAAGSGESAPAGVAMNQPVSDAGVATQTPSVGDPPEIDLAIAAGDDVTIHDAAPRTSVQLRFDGHCSTDTTVTAVTPGKTVTARGKTRATLELAPGTWTYAAECDADRPAFQPGGTIRVLHDDASEKVAVEPARSDIDADGRTWRISYRTRIPDVRVKVPAGTTAIRITQTRSGSAIEVPVRDGVAVITSNRLAQGQYTITTKPTNAKTTTLIIDFDSAAPQLQIARVRSRPSGSSMIVSGTSAPGWTLSIDGAKVPLDSRGRFEATARGFERVILRAEHPEHGVHYYVTLPITR